MTDRPADNLEQIVRTARQLIDAERMLAGDVMPAEANPLPEIAGASEAPGATEGDSLTPPQKAERLAELERQVAACVLCPLCKGRTQTVFGDGDPDARLLFIGEGPGADEDAQGVPFVGRAGQLLNKMIAAMGLARESVYIANVVKCRPPGNRAPTPDEGAACWAYLLEQIELIAPEVIVVLGNAATKALLGTKVGITRLRGHWQAFDDIPVMPTFHPSYLLRQYTPDNRRKVWSDLQAVMERLGLGGD